MRDPSSPTNHFTNQILGAEGEIKYFIPHRDLKH